MFTLGMLHSSFGTYCLFLHQLVFVVCEFPYRLQFGSASSICYYLSELVVPVASNGTYCFTYIDAVRLSIARVASTTVTTLSVTNIVSDAFDVVAFAFAINRPVLIPMLWSV